MGRFVLSRRPPVQAMCVHSENSGTGASLTATHVHRLFTRPRGDIEHKGAVLLIANMLNRQRPGAGNDSHGQLAPGS